MPNTTLSLCHVITYLMSEAQEHTTVFVGRPMHGKYSHHRGNNMLCSGINR